MIEFTLDALVEGESEDKYPRLYKKTQWPVLPREDDWFEILELENGLGNLVGRTWHLVNDDGTPRIHVEIFVLPHDYRTLVKSDVWKSEWTDL